MIATLIEIFPKVGKRMLSKHFVIKNRTITAFNGEEVCTLPIDCELDFAPLARPFLNALRSLEEPVKLWVNPDGNVMIQGVNEVKEIECAPLSRFPDPVPVGEWFMRKPKKASKNVPPEKTWLRDDYLPRLDEALAFRPDLFTTEELVKASMNRETLICDIEIFPNYLLVALMSYKSGKVIYFESVFSESLELDFFSSSLREYDATTEDLKWVLEHFTIVTFNGNNFDSHLLAMILAGKCVGEIKEAADKIIVQELRGWQVLKSDKVKKFKFDHIDIVEVLPLDASLKLYGARIHVPKIQELPFDPNAYLNEVKISIVRFYCIGIDLVNTAFSFASIREQIELREKMGERYGLDLRSKSDAQIAEAVINSELQRVSFNVPTRPEIPTSTKYRYKTPGFIRFQTPLLNHVLATIQGWEFWLDEFGNVRLPIDPNKPLKKGKPQSVDLSVVIANATYTLGIGGLHSNETRAAFVANSEFSIYDRDVTSYYPSIILNLELFPKHLGPEFLQVYRSIVQRRIEAKKNKQKVEAETLKIVVNGSFGKFGNKWSTLYSPDLLLTVTITGQLSLLMLIEALELSGIRVLSANTDGIVSHVPKDKESTFKAIFEEWEHRTGFKTEQTEYAALYSRDVNNYIAVKPDGTTKAKGAYFNPWAYPEYSYDRLKKNPSATIIIEAVTKFLTHKKPIMQTVNEENDVRKFLLVRTVRGGACKNGNYLGRAVRWYFRKDDKTPIVYVSSGNKVPNSDGAAPMPDLPQGNAIPSDLDRARYGLDALSILAEIGAIEEEFNNPDSVLEYEEPLTDSQE